MHTHAGSNKVTMNPWKAIHQKNIRVTQIRLDVLKKKRKGKKAQN